MKNFNTPSGLPSSVLFVPKSGPELLSTESLRKSGIELVKSIAVPPGMVIAVSGSFTLAIYPGACSLQNPEHGMILYHLWPLPGNSD
jgi:hypothetical protein